MSQEQLLETELSKNPSIRRLQYVLDVVLSQDYENILISRNEVYDKVSQQVQLQKLIRDDMQLTTRKNISENSAASSSTSNQQQQQQQLQTQQEQETEDITMLHEVGCKFYTPCKLIDPRVIHVNVGCDVIVAMTIDEALKFSKKAEDSYRMRGEKLTRDALNAKYKMRLVTEAIMRLQEIQIEKDVRKKRT